nr:MAG TPA_asm: hypothetical protein [Caudoviricetes sp.]
MILPYLWSFLFMLNKKLLGIEEFNIFIYLIFSQLKPHLVN